MNLIWQEPSLVALPDQPDSRLIRTTIEYQVNGGVFALVAMVDPSSPVGGSWREIFVDLPNYDPDVWRTVQFRYSFITITGRVVAEMLSTLYLIQGEGPPQRPINLQIIPHY